MVLAARQQLTIRSNASRCANGDADEQDGQDCHAQHLQCHGGGMVVAQGHEEDG